MVICVDKVVTDIATEGGKSGIILAQAWDFYIFRKEDKENQKKHTVFFLLLNTLYLILIASSQKMSA